MSTFEALGGHPAKNAGEVGASADAVFIMVMNGDQAKSIIFGEGGLTSTMSKGGLILLTATINSNQLCRGKRRCSGPCHLRGNPIAC